MYTSMYTSMYTNVHQCTPGNVFLHFTPRWRYSASLLPEFHLPGRLDILQQFWASPESSWRHTENYTDASVCLHCCELQRWPTWVSCSFPLPWAPYSTMLPNHHSHQHSPKKLHAAAEAQQGQSEYPIISGMHPGGGASGVIFWGTGCPTYSTEALQCWNLQNENFRNTLARRAGDLKSSISHSWTVRPQIRMCCRHNTSSRCTC